MLFLHAGIEGYSYPRHYACKGLQAGSHHITLDRETRNALQCFWFDDVIRASLSFVTSSQQ